jgi:hypothetical protein
VTERISRDPFRPPRAIGRDDRCRATAGQRLLDAAMRDFAHVFTKGQAWLLNRFWHGTGRLAALAQRTHFLARLKSGIPLRRTSVTLPDVS